ncbi:hypothetical protein LCGC14_2209620 [marine sediment metagenome]|uniref:Transposase IS200-like domain-containing protein n=1 Tax=marine sediment metagenome TaxID=412755 RepID=A0A0F9DE45_9ZZZZ
MNKSSLIRAGRHCVFLIHIHLVFVTKYRKDVLTKESIASCRESFTKVCKKFDAQLKEFNGEEDHVHLLVNYPPKISVSKLVNSLKGASSRVLRKLHPEIQKRLFKGHLWSPSYFAGSCGGASLDTIKKYIQNQQAPVE